MRIVVILFTLICFGASISCAQKVSINATNTPLETVFNQIKNQTDYSFIYTKELLQKARPVNFVINNVSVNEALEKIFASQPLYYTIYNKQIVVKERDIITNVKNEGSYFIKGTVSDESGNVVPGAIVFITNSKYITTTNDAGEFSFDDIQPGSYEVVIKMLGFNPAVLSVDVQTRPVKIIAVLTESVTALNEGNVSVAKKIISKADQRRYYGVVC
jgi:hypothetical protein